MKTKDIVMEKWDNDEENNAEGRSGGREGESWEIGLRGHELIWKSEID